VDGELVQVSSDRGDIQAVCRISDRVRPGIAWMPFGGLHDGTGARRSVNLLTAEEPTDWGGGSGLYDTFVEVRPARLSGSTGDASSSSTSVAATLWPRA
jgi:anaerobic selenocysteine-containing dehydrogenase